MSAWTLSGRRGHRFCWVRPPAPCSPGVNEGTHRFRGLPGVTRGDGSQLCLRLASPERRAGPYRLGRWSRSSPAGTGGPWLLLSCYPVLLSRPRAGGGKGVEPSGRVVPRCTGIILPLLFLYLIVLKSYWCFKTILKCSHINTLLISTAGSAIFTSWLKKRNSLWKSSFIKSSQLNVTSFFKMHVKADSKHFMHWCEVRFPVSCLCKSSFLNLY